MISKGLAFLLGVLRTAVLLMACWLLLVSWNAEDQLEGIHIILAAIFFMLAAIYFKEGK